MLASIKLQTVKRKRGGSRGRKSEDEVRLENIYKNNGFSDDENDDDDDTVDMTHKKKGNGRQVGGSEEGGREQNWERLDSTSPNREKYKVDEAF